MDKPAGSEFMALGYGAAAMRDILLVWDSLSDEDRLALGFGDIRGAETRVRDMIAAKRRAKMCSL